ncbi:MAG: helix-hairpin-helix domain-containing protein [Desulfobacter sp.]|nr:helix-hairpin-helix domain-containing protein [Desulfobacter sp.]
MTDDELRLAKERLMKLWDAYESQEKEMAAALARIKDLEEKEKDKERIILTLRELVDSKDAELRKYEIKGSSLDKETSEYKERLQEVTESLNMERSRYKKLYIITQELEGEVDTLTKELESRDRWFRDNLSFFDELPHRMGKRMDMIDSGSKKRSVLEELGAPSDKPRPKLAPAASEATFEKVDPKKEAMKDLLDIPGIDEDKAKVLMDAGFGDVEKLKGASPFELVKLDGITPTLARKITEHVKA